MRDITSFIGGGTSCFCGRVFIAALYTENDTKNDYECFRSLIFAVSLLHYKKLNEEINPMAKTQDTKKTTKKAATRTPAEKKALKVDKKKAKSTKYGN